MSGAFMSGAVYFLEGYYFSDDNMGYFFVGYEGEFLFAATFLLALLLYGSDAYAESLPSLYVITSSFVSLILCLDVMAGCGSWYYPSDNRSVSIGVEVRDYVGPVCSGTG